MTPTSRTLLPSPPLTPDAVNSAPQLPPTTPGRPGASPGVETTFGHGHTTRIGGLNGWSPHRALNGRTSPTSTIFNAALGSPQPWEVSTVGALSGLSTAGPPPTSSQYWAHRKPREVSTGALTGLSRARPPPPQFSIGHTADPGGLNGWSPHRALNSRTSPTSTQHWAHRNHGRSQRLEPLLGSQQPDLSHFNSALGTPQPWDSQSI